MTAPSEPGVEPGPSIGYGIIGTGMMGVEHIHNVRAIDGARIVAISDPTEASRTAGVQAAADPQVAAFADHRDLLAHPGVDAVVVASPNHTHHPILADVLDAGVHLLVEKPLCTTVGDCLDVIDRATATAVSFPDRGEVAGGAVGRPRMVAIREHRFPFLVKVGDWNRFSANTGGTLVEKCCHFFDLMNLLIGERPSRVMASGAQDVNHVDEVYDGRPSDILDNAFVIVDYHGRLELEPAPVSLD